MQNEQLILDNLMEIKEDIGSMKSKDESLEGWMTSLDSKVTTIQKNCGNAFTLQISRNQVVLIGGSIITAIAAFCGLGGTQ